MVLSFGAEERDMLKALVEDFTSVTHALGTIDSETAEAREQSDKDNIFKIIHRDGGLRG